MYKNYFDKKIYAHNFEQNTVSSAINKLIFYRHFD